MAAAQIGATNVCVTGACNTMKDCPPLSAAELFPGDGTMLAAVHTKDWCATPLGPVHAWPPELRVAASLCLYSQFQMAIAWGPQLVYLYNDATVPIFGAKHPWALGRPVAEVWPEAWDTIGPMLQSVQGTGQAMRRDDLLLVLERNGFAEECYFTFSYSPIRLADGGTGGVFVTTLETSDRVVVERRQRTLAGLATEVALHAGTGVPLEALCAVLTRNPYDVPFAALWLDDGDGRAVLAFSTDASLMHDAGAARAAVLGRHAARVLASGAALLDSEALPALAGRGGWDEAPRQVLAVPFERAGDQAASGVLLLAANPRRPFDAAQRAFLDSVAGHVANAVAALDARMAERQRAAALAELDRSKSRFFANASHELRTPLTLILGPLAALAEQGDAGLAAWRENAEMAYRNALRLHKLVNSLMDFATIEAGRLPLLLEPVDPCALTREVAGLFRSAIEAGGVTLAVDCGEPAGRVMLDREMWEKIVFNLLSNALKFTPAGRIDVRLRRTGAWLELTVADSGIGIGREDIGRVFERFYRSRHAAGRAAEGSGVGLALVEELVRLHGGQVSVHSELGQGATFTVAVPWREAARGGPPRTVEGTVDLARRRRHAQFSDEVRSYGIGAELARAAASVAAPAEGAMRVVVVDDNRDVVRYIERLLGESCLVVPAYDAAGGLAAVRVWAPDLVLVDVMMPGVDGLELVRRIRADRAIHTVSVLVLSARAGEEARLDALEAGADDYLAKPFSARELSARVRAHVQMARIRRAAIEQERVLLREIAAVRHDLDSVLEGTSDAFVRVDRELRMVALNDAAVPRGRERAALIGRPLAEVAPRLAGSPVEAALREAVQGRHPAPVEQLHARSGRWFSVRCYPAPQGAILFANDITSRVLAEQELRQAHDELECRVEQRTAELREAHGLLAAVFDRAPGGIAITDLEGKIVRVNAAYAALTGYPAAELPFRPASERVDAADLARLRAGQARLLAGQVQSFEIEMRYRCPDGRRPWVSNFISMIEDGVRRYFVAIARDITERKRVEAERQTAQLELRTLYERLQTVRESERTALAREVHDQLGQILSAAKIDIKLLEDDLRRGTRPLAREAIIAELGSASATLERAIGLVREIATELRAPELDEQGLYAAIGWHARDFELRTRIACKAAFPERRPHPSRPAAAALLRIFQEALTNVLRHAQASEVRVSLVRRGGALVLRVCDNGIGIARGRLRAGGSLGLQGMRERAELVDGRLLAGPLPGGGTLVTARVPLKDRKSST
jgi:PAS domain S-box-containing protein